MAGKPNISALGIRPESLSTEMEDNPKLNTSVASVPFVNILSSSLDPVKNAATTSLIGYNRHAQVLPVDDDGDMVEIWTK